MLQRLDAEIKKSLLSGERDRAETLKMLKSAVLLEQKTQANFTDADFLAVVRKQIKMRTDAIEMYRQSGSTENQQKEESEVAILTEFLPEQLTDEQLSQKIDEIAAAQSITFEKQNMGRLIGVVAQEVGDSASKSDIAKVINSKIS